MNARKRIRRARRILIVLYHSQNLIAITKIKCVFGKNREKRAVKHAVTVSEFLRNKVVATRFSNLTGANESAYRISNRYVYNIKNAR